MHAGFKLDWLKSKLDEVSLDKNKADADGSLTRRTKSRAHGFFLLVDKVA